MCTLFLFILDCPRLRGKLGQANSDILFLTAVPHGRASEASDLHGRGKPGMSTVASNNSVENGSSSNLTLVEAALNVLNEADPLKKASAGEAAATSWLQGNIPRAYSDADSGLLSVPDRPARLSNVTHLPNSLTQQSADLPLS